MRQSANSGDKVLHVPQSTPSFRSLALSEYIGGVETAWILARRPASHDYLDLGAALSSLRRFLVKATTFDSSAMPSVGKCARMVSAT